MSSLKEVLGPNWCMAVEEVCNFQANDSQRRSFHEKIRPQASVELSLKAEFVRTAMTRMAGRPVVQILVLVPCKWSDRRSPIVQDHGA